jgi:hypothetical protein
LAPCFPYSFRASRSSSSIGSFLSSYLPSLLTLL